MPRTRPHRSSQSRKQKLWMIILILVVFYFGYRGITGPGTFSENVKDAVSELTIIIKNYRF